MAEEDMTSNLICPCECAMVISTCECTTAIQVKKEVAQMEENGFSGKQIFSALQAEYGKDIVKHPEKINTMSIWLAGASLSILLVFLGYIFTSRKKLKAIPDIKRYEEQFEEEYRKFVNEMEKK
ncbi:MAG: cytochrome c-type biogenesis protein CcmH [Candidatus Methanoperedens sp.]|nr:cytochrome c-type biogenesis protein CcmH [Candidatus Methanoperedens sp.]